MTHRLPLLTLAALALVPPAPGAAQTAPQDFRLPPAPTPTASSRVQGPVDEDAPVPVRPRPIPTATPTAQPSAAVPASPTPAPTAAASPTPRPAGTVAPAIRPAATPDAAAPAGAEPAAEAAPPFGFATAAPEPSTATSGAPSSVPAASTPATTESEDDAGNWTWVLAALAILAAAAAAARQLRRRSARPVVAPEIERPAAAPRPAPAPAAAAAGSPPLALRAEAVKLTRSFAFATLDYRLTVINRTQAALAGVAIKADLVAAHGDAPMEAQVALPATDLPQAHVIDRLAPGQSQQLTGQLRLPLGEARVIFQGNLPLLVPLLRLRIDGAGPEPLTRTLVIGQTAPGSPRLQPFNLQEPPRAYQPIAQRELA